MKRLCGKKTVSSSDRADIILIVRRSPFTRSERDQTLAKRFLRSWRSDLSFACSDDQPNITMTVSSLLDALVLTQFGVLSITQHRQTLASLRQSDGTGNTTKLSWTLKAVKTLLKVQSAMHALDYLTLVALQEGFGAPTLTWSAKLAAALVSLQLDQLVAVKPAFVAAFVAFSSVVALMREIFTQPALTFCIVSAASNAPLLVLLLQHLYTSVRRSDSMVLRNSNTDLLDLAYEKASAAEDGHAVNEKPVVYKGYAILSTDTWKDFKLIDFTVRVPFESSMQKNNS